MAVDTRAPTAPTGLTAKAGDSQVALAWLRSTDNVGVVGYYVWRKLASAPSGVGWVRIASPVALAYTDRAVTNGTGYIYAVRAVDRVGNVSASSAFVTATPKAASPSVAAIYGIALYGVAIY